MSPVNLEHDQIQGWLYRLFSEFVEERGVGRICGAEYMVRLPRPAVRRLTDLFFVSQPRVHLLKETYLEGAPDLIVEVVSPDSTARDYRDKFEDYRANAVKEGLLQKFPKLQANQFAIAGKGWERPADPGDPQNQAKNRRVEVKVYPAEAVPAAK